MNTAPVIVLSVPDAGAHRFAAMLGMYPRARPLPELELCLAGRVDELLAMAEMADDNVLDGLLRAVGTYFAETHKVSGNAAIRYAHDWLRRRLDWTTSALLGALIEQLQPHTAVFPDTRSVWRPAWLDWLVEALPEARFIHLVRHPRAQCDVIARHLKRESFVPPDYKDFGADGWPRIDPQLAWFRINRNIDSLLSDLPAGRWCRVIHEALQVNPEQQLHRVAQWLDWPLDQDVIEQRLLHPEQGLFSRRGPALAPGHADKAFLRDPAFHRVLRPRLSLTGPLEWRDDDVGFAPEVTDQAHRFGYR